MRLFLVRHGNTFGPEDKVVMVGSRSNLPLVEFGHQQAARLSQYFVNQSINFNKVYSGNLMRQQQTAQYFSDLVLLNPALDELDYGPWEGLTMDEIRTHWAKELEDWELRGIWPEGLFGNNFESKRKLIQNWVENLIKEQKDSDTVLAVSSGGTIRLFLSLIPELWRDIDFKAYKVGTGHFCELLITPEHKLKIVAWNQSAVI